MESHYTDLRLSDIFIMIKWNLSDCITMNKMKRNKKYWVLIYSRSGKKNEIKERALYKNAFHTAHCSFFFVCGFWGFFFSVITLDKNSFRKEKDTKPDCSQWPLDCESQNCRGNFSGLLPLLPSARLYQQPVSHTNFVTLQER